MNFSAKLRSVLAELNSHHGGASFGNPRTIPKKLSDFPVNSSATGQVFSWGGMKLGLSTASHAAAALQIAFDEMPTAGDDSLWYNLGVNGSVRRPDGLPFKRFFARLQSGVAQSTKAVVLVIDPDPASGSGDTVQEGPRLGNVSVTGKMQVECGFLTLAQTDVSGAASDEGAVATAGWTGAAYARHLVDASGRQIVVGPAASGAAVAGSPVLMGGSDGTNARTLTVVPTNTSPGANPPTLVAGGIDAGGAVRALPTIVGATAYTAANVYLATGGTDAVNARMLLLDTSGRTIAVGAAADAAAPVGNPVLVGGHDFQNGLVKRLPLAPVGQNIGSYVYAMGGSDGTLTTNIRTDTSGRTIAVGPAADAAAAVGSPLLVAGTFSSNVKTLICAAANATTTIDGTAGNSRLAVQNQGSTTIATLWSAAAVGINGTSSTFTTYGHRRIEIFGNTNAATTLTVQFSQDSATWFDATSGTAAGQTPSVAANGNFSLSFDTGAPYVRLKSSAAATITALGGAKA